MKNRLQFFTIACRRAAGGMSCAAKGVDRRMRHGFVLRVVWCALLGGLSVSCRLLGEENEWEWTTERRAVYLFHEYAEHVYPGMSMIRTALCFNEYLKCATDAQREELQERCLPEWRIFRQDEQWELWHYGYVLRIRFAEGHLLDESGTVWEIQGRTNRGRIGNRKGTYHFEFSYRDGGYDATALWSFRAFPIADGYTLAVQGAGRVEREESSVRIDYTIDAPLADKANGRLIDGVVSLDAYPYPAAGEPTRTSLPMHPAVYGKVRVKYGPEKWVTLEMEGETYLAKLYTTLE